MQPDRSISRDSPRKELGRSRLPFLRVPPFPGARPPEFGRPVDGSVAPEGVEADVVAAIVDVRVGGTYWGGQPELPIGAYRLVKLRGSSGRPRVEQASTSPTDLIWDERPIRGSVQVDPDTNRVHGCCDPWHMVAGATEVVTDGDDELALIAALAGIPVTIVGDGPYVALDHRSAAPGEQRSLIARFLGGFAYVDPFTGDRLSIGGAVEYCRTWRSLIDANRPIAAAVGFAAWKRQSAAPLLWSGSGKVRFTSVPGPIPEQARLAVWKSRTPQRTLDALTGRDELLMEVEDGFIRSIGLGADCVPPLSIVVDPVGIYFDPARPSRLEQLLEQARFSPALVARAGRLREAIIAGRLSKYGSGHDLAKRPSTGREVILVPGQVEDDRSILCGGGPATNLELLRRVRQEKPRSFIVYKPHPDVEAGHRVGAIARDQCLALADAIESGGSIASLIDTADEVHVNTSLAGFDALLRGKPVTTYGVPFYAGWGLTRDLGPVPSRRTARRSLEELIAAALILYPRYLDPVTGLPCPPETLIGRLTSGRTVEEGLLVRLRRLQGRWKRQLSEWRAGMGK